MAMTCRSIIGSDEATDIAVLRVRGNNAGRFQYVTFDDASHVRVGDWVVAVSNPLVSMAQRPRASFRRWDAAMRVRRLCRLHADRRADQSRQLGRSDVRSARGNVIGVNSAIFSPTGGNVGIGFAIPANTANAPSCSQILQNGRVSRGWIGVSIQPLDRTSRAASVLKSRRAPLVATVVPDGPAARAGIQQDGVISRSAASIQTAVI